MKRLRLNLETVRVLSGSTLDRVNGGAGGADTGMAAPSTITASVPSQGCIQTCFCTDKLTTTAQGVQ